MFDLTMIWVLLIGFGILMYVISDGFDLGVGVLFWFTPDETLRDQMMQSIAPVWDGNETWLILGGAGLLAAFPLIYAVFLPALYLGVFLMLAGLILRGVAFEFRFNAGPKGRRFWGQAFAFGSTLAAFAQGVVVGAYIQGMVVVDGQFAGNAFDWLSVFTVITGLALVVGYTLLGGGWLIFKTRGALYARIKQQIWWVWLAMLGLMLLSIVFSLQVQPLIGQRWRENPIWVLVGLVLLSVLLLRLYQVIHAGRHGRGQHADITIFALSLLVFLVAFVSLIASLWPYAIVPTHTFADAASSEDSQMFILIGASFVLPLVLIYSAWTYWMFRGKINA